MNDLIANLHLVAGSPLAFAAYIVTVFAWIARIWIIHRPITKANKLLELYSDDLERSAALKSLLGIEPPKGISRKDLLEWVKIQAKVQNRMFLLLSYAITLITILLICALVVFHTTRQSQSKAEDRPPVLIESELIRSTDLPKE